MVQYRAVKRRRVGSKSAVNNSIGTKYTRNHKSSRSAPARPIINRAVLTIKRRKPVGPVRMVRAVQNRLSGRASMKLSGKKAKIPGTKHVKVSKTLRSKIKEVMKSGTARGTYTKILHQSTGVISANQVAGTAGATVTSTQFGVATLDAYSRVQCGGGGFQGSLQGAMVLGNMDTGVLDVVGGADWNFFSAAKYLDAASILFNNKTAALDYSATAGNMSVFTQLSTNTPVLTKQLGLKLDIIDSFVKWDIKNTSARAVYIEFYVCAPKLKFISENALTTFRVAAETETGTTVVKGNGDWVQNTANKALYGADLAKMIGIDPNAFKGFSSLWSYEKTSMYIKPGEECVHKIQGPKNFTVDFNTLQPAGGGYDGTALNKFSKSVFIRVHPDLVQATTLSLLGSSALSNPGYWIKNNLGNDSIIDPVAIRMEEVFKIQCPEVAGFIANAGIAAGASQMLNLRKPAKAFFTWPWSETYAADKFTWNMGLTSFVGFDEENPVTAIGAGTNY